MFVTNYILKHRHKRAGASRFLDIEAEVSDEEEDDDDDEEEAAGSC